MQSLNLRLGSTPSIARPFTWVLPKATSNHCWPANFDVCLVHDEDGRIPLHLAVLRGRVEVVQELITAVSNSVLEKLNGNTVYTWRCNNAPKQLVKQLKEDEVFDFGDHLGNTILHSAVLLKQNRGKLAVKNIVCGVLLINYIIAN